jgi:hypothetical protein
MILIKDKSTPLKIYKTKIKIKINKLISFYWTIVRHMIEK